ncbi:DEAD/DEAH box helicase [Candidatus Micrarchaeota archaeon]|nr:DEAD/DEAH box helicase [Candidatus Micrarchaeota archaeon]
MKFTDLTDVQKQAIPYAIQGEDLIVQSRTGTGKTAAFAIPILENAWKKPVVQALVLTPTRELAVQVGTDFKKIGKYTHVNILVAYGGVGIDPQIGALREGVQIVVGTPGRIIDLIERRELDISQIQFLVLDEADVMLAMGFVRDVERIISFTPQKRQIMLFCVDLPDEIIRLTKKHLHYPNHVKLVSEDISAQGVRQSFYVAPPGRKLSALLYLLNELKPSKTLIFCRTKRSVDQLVRQLNHNSINAEGIQGNLTQAKRERIMHDFKNGVVSILVATDIASRGIHVESISHVFNYELPYDINYYVHRIGRTGRMQAVGDAVALCYHDELGTLGQIERLIGKRLEEKELPKSLPIPKMPAYEPRSRDYRGGRSGGGGGRGFSRGPRTRSSEGGRFPRRSFEKRREPPRGYGYTRAR